MWASIRLFILFSFFILFPLIFIYETLQACIKARTDGRQTFFSSRLSSSTRQLLTRSQKPPSVGQHRAIDSLEHTGKNRQTTLYYLLACLHEVVSTSCMTFRIKVKYELSLTLPVRIMLVNKVIFF